MDGVHEKSPMSRRANRVTPILSGWRGASVTWVLQGATFTSPLVNSLYTVKLTLSIVDSVGLEGNHEAPWIPLSCQVITNLTGDFMIKITTTRRLATAVSSLAFAAATVGATAASAQESNLSFNLGVEYLALGFFASQGASGDAGPAPVNFDDYFADYGVNGVPRVTLGAELNDGMGARLRFFEFDETEFYLGLDRNVNFRIVDAEVYFPLFSEGGREVEVFAGYRDAFIHLDGSDFGEPNPYEFDGGGFTAGANFRMPIMDSDFAFRFGGRYSLMQGDVNFQPVSGLGLDNVLVHAFDVNIGAEYTRSLGAVDLTAHAGWEMQYYGTDTYFPFAIDPESLGDVGLSGFTAGIMLTF